VQALTGHKTPKLVERYVNIKANDAVKVLHAPEPQMFAPASQPGHPVEAALMAQLSAQLATADAAQRLVPAVTPAHARGAAAKEPDAPSQTQCV
jgi:hypothetical protein